jgi:hypothetical protein
VVGGVWLVFEEVYGVKWKKCEKLLKKRSSKFFGREFWRLVCVLKKKDREIFWPAPPPKLISPYALESKYVKNQWGRGLLRILSQGLSGKSYGPVDHAHFLAVLGGY